MAKHPLAKFLISIPEALERLEASGLSKSDIELATHSFHYAIDEGFESEEQVAWVDVPWAKLGFEPVPAKRGVKRKSAKRATDGSVGLVVFTKPVVSKHALTMRYEDLLGYREDRNETVFVFLGEVKARDVCMLPGVTAVFAGGLTVARLAVFDGADSHAQVGHHLHAPLVISGVGGGGGVLSKGCEVKVAAYARYIDGMPKGSVRALPSVAKLLPFTTEIDHEAERVEEDADAWELYESVYKDREFPADFKVPALPRTATRTPEKKAAKAKKRVAKVVRAKKKTSR